MMNHLRYLCVFLCCGACSNVAHGEAEAQNISILCRMTVVETTHAYNADGHDDQYASHQTKATSVCIPIINDTEHDNYFAVAIPDHISMPNRQSLAHGRLWVRIDAKRVGVSDSNSLVVDGLESAHFHVVSPPPKYNDRYLQEATLGEMTVAVLRVSTADSTPSTSVDEIETLLLGNNTINFRTQSAACSFGKLRWKSTGVFDVQLNQTLSAYNHSYFNVIHAAQAHMVRTMDIQSVSDVADRVIVCLPPGTGDWAGSAGVMHWRLQMNDGWCTSLSGVMHELGHTLGLLHAGTPDGNVYGDMTGYMGSSYRTRDWPRKCFNGYHSWKLKWYSDRTKTLVPTDRPQFVHLAAFVDYIRTSSDEPVVLNIEGELYLQYNRAKSFNVDVDHKRNMVTVSKKSAITEMSSSLGGLGVGDSLVIASFQGSLKKLVVSVCRYSAGTLTSPDVMVLGIVFESVNACDFEYGETGATTQPVYSPIPALEGTLAPATSTISQNDIDDIDPRGLAMIFLSFLHLLRDALAYPWVQPTRHYIEKSQSQSSSWTKRNKAQLRAWVDHSNATPSITKKSSRQSASCAGAPTASPSLAPTNSFGLDRDEFRRVYIVVFTLSCVVALCILCKCISVLQ